MLKQTFLLALVPAALAAQQPPPIRLMNAPEASSKPVLTLAAAVRELPGGKLLVNDVGKRQLLLFDNTLGTVTVVADSVSGGANSYGTRPGGIIPWLGDSTLFIDPAGLSMFVLDPSGNIARVASVPRSQDAVPLSSNLAGMPGVDAKGRIVYRGSGIGQRITGAPPRQVAGAASSGPVIQMAEPPDSAAIVRIDPATRKLDTASFIKVPKNKMNMNVVDGRMNMSMEVNPMQTIDDWAVMADGSIAIVRGRDYHIDWINADGSVTASPKLPFDWQRLSDEDKIAVIDSAKAAMEKARASAPAGGAPGSAQAVVEGVVRTNVQVMSFGGGGGGDRIAFGGPGGGGATTTFVSPSELPDYRPAFNQNSVRADVDGNLWIRTTAVRPGSVGGGPVYDIVNRNGVVVDRVQVPAGRQIVGFGKGGVVYMIARDDKGSWIEKAKR
jgi:hypothetical protein